MIFTVTNAGRAALVNAQANGTNAVLIATAGLSSTAVAPDPSMTALPGQFKTVATLSGTVADDDTIHLIIRDESADDFTLRSLGLYLDDGTLFGLYGQAEPVLVKTASSIMLFEVNVEFEDIDATEIAFGDANFLNPPATESMMGIAEIATQAESDGGADDSRIVTPKKAKASFLAWMASLFSDLWRASNDGAGSGLDADLLDGQQGAFYQNAGNLNAGTLPAARLSGTYNISIAGAAASLTTARSIALSGGATGAASFDGSANVAIAATLTPSAVLAALATVDGSGSGSDSDTVDGLHATAFLRRSTNIWLTSEDGVNRLYFANNGNTYLNVPAGGSVVYQSDSVDRVSIGSNGSIDARGVIRVGVGAAEARLDTSGDIIADRGNGTGAIFFGSPLVAPSHYLYFDGEIYQLPNAELYLHGGLVWHGNNVAIGGGGDGFGYMLFPNGYKFMHGSASVGVNASATVNFPASFSQFAFVHVNGGVINATQQDNGPFVTSSIFSLGSFNVYSALDSTVNFTWTAWGR